MLAGGGFWLLAMTISGAAAQPPATVPVEADLETGVRVAQYLRDAQRKREAGQVAEPLADLRAANALIKKMHGDNHPDTLPVLDLAGLILLENGQFAEAQNPLRKAVSLREALRAEGKGVSPVESAATLVLLARAQMGAGTFEPAVELITKAVELLAASVGPGHPSTEAAEERLADAHFAMGNASAGQAELEQLLERRKQQADRRADILATATLVARAQAWQGKAMDSIEPLATAVAAHERLRGDMSAVPVALRQLAELQAECGDFEAAGASLERARTIDRKLSGEDGVASLIDSLLRLKLDVMRGDTVAAQEACGPIVSAIDAFVARDDPQAASALRTAAEVRLEGGDLGSAAELFRRALELDTKLLGVDHPDTAADEAGLGRCLMGSGDTKAARPLLDHALAVSKRVRGPFHAETLSILTEVGECAAQAGDLATASGILKTLIDRGVARRSDAFEGDLCNLVDGVAGLEERKGNPERAMETRYSLIGLRQQQFGQQHARVADVMVRLANARQAAGAHADAVALYQKAITIMEQVRSANDPEVAAILAPLAVSYRALDANEQAEESLARGLAIWEASVGPDHPVTIATLKPLAQVRLALRQDDAALPLMTRLLAAYDADPATPPADQIKLLKKLAQLQEARGAADIARGYLERAVAAEGALGKSAMAAGDMVGDDGLAVTAKLEKMLSVDKEAEASLSKARRIAADLQGAQQKLANTGPTAVARPAAPAGATAGSVAPRTAPTGAETTITTAWKEYRGGQRSEAVGLLRDAATALERQPESTLTGQQRADLAALLVARADMRPQPLAWQEATGLYKRGLTLAASALGEGHPTTLAYATTLSTALLASGDPRAAGEIEALMTSKAVQASRSATPEQLERLRESLRGAAQVAWALGDRAAAVRAIDTLLKLGTALDEQTILFGLDTLDTLLPAGAKDEAAGHARTRYVQAANRLVPSRPAIAGYALHHLALAEDAAGKSEAAVALWRRAIDTDRKALGANHPRVVWHVVSLATVEKRRGNAAGAEQLLSDAAKMEAGLESVPADQVADLRRLATARGDTGAFDRATRLLAAALKAEQTSGSGSPLVIAEIAETSARFAARRGQEKRARDLWEETAGIVQAARGGGHPAAVAAAISRDRLARAPAPAIASAPTAAKPATGVAPAQAQATSRFADLLAKRSADGGASTQRATAAGPQPQAADVIDDGAAPVPMSAAGEKAMRAFDAATRLYGGDPSKKKSKAGAGRRGMEAIVGYLGNMEALANGQDGGLPTAADRGGSPSAARPSTRAMPAPAPAAQEAAADAPAAAPTPVRRGTFVAASQSGLRQRTALARQRATGKAAAPVTVDQLMRAAWSAHEWGSRTEAIAACEQALELAGRQAGESSPAVAEVLDQFATIAVAQGDLRRGKQLLERLGSLRWKLLGPTDPAVSDAAIRLAALLVECGELERAAGLATRAATVRQATRAQAAVILGEIRLAQGEPAAAAARLAEARQFVAEGDSSQQFAVRLASVRLARDLGDLQTADLDLDAIWSAGVAADRLPPAAVRSIVREMVRTRRLAGEPAVAADLARRLGDMTAAVSAVGMGIDQVEMAFAQQAAADPAWETTAERASGVLLPAMARLTDSATDPAAIEAVVELAELWLGAGRLDKAEGAVAAAVRGAITLPPGHRVTGRVARTAARLALSQGDLPRARAALERDRRAQSARVELRPSLPPARELTFLEAATDADSRQAFVARRAARAPVVSGPPGPR